MILNDFIQGIPTKAGVYQFYVYHLDKYYIGESVNIRRRILEHLRGWGKEEIHKTVTLYGLDALGFQILCFEDDRKTRLQKEEFFKNKYGYRNLINSVYGKEDITPDTSKPIVIYNIKGEYVGTWRNSIEASLSLNVSKDSLRLAASGNRKTGSGYFCFYKNETIDIEKKLVESLANYEARNIYLKQKAKNNTESCKKVVFAKKGTEEYIFMSGKDAALFFNIKPANISACCLGKLKTYKNFEWSYINE